MRSRLPTRLVALVLVFILLPSVPSLALAQAPVPSVPAAQGPAPVDLAWPWQMETGGNVILIYHRQPVKWEGNRLEARAAEGFSLHADVADSSVIAWRRKTTEAVETGGVPGPVGANLLLGSANRDPAAFETPERFDIHRLKPVGRINLGSSQNAPRSDTGPDPPAARHRSVSPDARRPRPRHLQEGLAATAVRKPTVARILPVAMWRKSQSIGKSQ